MRNVIAIVRREINTYFLSFMAYGVIFLFIVLGGLFFQGLTWRIRQANMEPMFNIIGYLLLLITPLLTMRLMAEEARSGTIETLLTAPVAETQLILGKFLGAMLFYICILAYTLIYAAMLAWLGNLDGGAVLVGYLGLMLRGALFVSVGLFCSCLTRSQVIAGVAAIAILLLLFLAGAMAGYASGPLYDLMRYASFYARAGADKGVLDTRDIVYFLSLSAFFVFLSVRAVESRKWR